jgi:hypothetical protein
MRGDAVHLRQQTETHVDSRTPLFTQVQYRQLYIQHHLALRLYTTRALRTTGVNWRLSTETTQATAAADDADAAAGDAGDNAGDGLSAEPAYTEYTDAHPRSAAEIEKYLLISMPVFASYLRIDKRRHTGPGLCRDALVPTIGTICAADSPYRRRNTNRSS